MGLKCQKHLGHTNTDVSLVEDLIRNTGDAGNRTCDPYIGNPAQVKNNLRITDVIGSYTICFSFL